MERTYSLVSIIIIEIIIIIIITDSVRLLWLAVKEIKKKTLKDLKPFFF